jgi:hypothetical protein
MITFFSFGGGQDSTDILYRLITDPVFHALYVKGKLIVTMSDTGDESEETYAHLAYVSELCARHGIEFHLLTSDQGYHPKSWPNLVDWMQRNRGIMSTAYPKSCTDNLKIKPLYNFLDHWIGKNIYGENLAPNVSKKRFIKRYASEHGKIRVIIGIAKGEESRVGGTFPHKWMEHAIERIYPLIEQGIDRSAIHDHIKAIGLPLPVPSKCKRCPFVNAPELVWMFRHDPISLKEWIELEKNKVEKWEALGTPREKNFGVRGKKYLPQVVEEALEKYGHWSDQQLNEYRMSHGHCIATKY